jgi:hypothetical protein
VIPQVRYALLVVAVVCGTVTYTAGWLIVKSAQGLKANRYVPYSQWT